MAENKKNLLVGKFVTFIELVRTEKGRFVRIHFDDGALALRGSGQSGPKFRKNGPIAMLSDFDAHYWFKVAAIKRQLSPITPTIIYNVAQSIAWPKDLGALEILRILEINLPAAIWAFDPTIWARPKQQKNKNNLKNN